MKGLVRLIRLVAILSAVAAVVQQLRRPKEQRTWTGRVAGIPYDFRPPTLERARQRWWNPNNPSLFGPHMFGVGWSVNLYQVWRRVSGLAGNK